MTATNASAVGAGEEGDIVQFLSASGKLVERQVPTGQRYWNDPK
jgi:hypothetical protein